MGSPAWLSSGGHHHLERGVIGEEAEELGAGVARRTDDADAVGVRRRTGSGFGHWENIQPN